QPEASKPVAPEPLEGPSNGASAILGAPVARPHSLSKATPSQLPADTLEDPCHLLPLSSELSPRPSPCWPYSSSMAPSPPARAISPVRSRLRARTPRCQRSADPQLPPQLQRRQPARRR